jgi:hypothetical protein
MLYNEDMWQTNEIFYSGQSMFLHLIFSIALKYIVPIDYCHIEAISYRLILYAFLLRYYSVYQLKETR